MSAAYFEDHPTDPNKVILRKRSCPFCQDKQRTWVGLDLDERAACYEASGGNLSKFADKIEAKLKEKNA